MLLTINVKVRHIIDVDATVALEQVITYLFLNHHGSLLDIKRNHIAEKCGFVAKHKEQLFVYYIDGNLNNNSQSNLKTICANCQYEVARAGLGWRQGDLVPDF